MEQGVLDGYVEDASFLIQSFEAISSSDLLSNVLDFIPNYPCKVLEVGAGTGRDAAWLVTKGLDVLAVEPVAEFREAGKSLHPSRKIEWVNDTLPSLSHIVQRNDQYELALLVSVWQHVPKEQKFASLSTLHSILNKGGRLILSVRNGADSIKRKCYPTSAKETVYLAQQSGFELTYRRDAESLQVNNQQLKVTWTWLVFTAG